MSLTVTLLEPVHYNFVQKMRQQNAFHITSHLRLKFPAIIVLNSHHQQMQPKVWEISNSNDQRHQTIVYFGAGHAQFKIFLNISCLANYVQKRISLQQFLKSEEHKKYQKFYFRFNRFWRECFEFEMLSPKTVKPEMKFLLLFVVFILHELLQ